MRHCLLVLIALAIVVGRFDLTPGEWLMGMVGSMSVVVALSFVLALYKDNS